MSLLPRGIYTECTMLISALQDKVHIFSFFSSQFLNKLASKKLYFILVWRKHPEMQSGFDGFGHVTGFYPYRSLQTQLLMSKSHALELWDVNLHEIRGKGYRNSSYCEAERSKGPTDKCKYKFIAVSLTKKLGLPGLQSLQFLMPLLFLKERRNYIEALPISSRKEKGKEKEQHQVGGNWAKYSVFSASFWRIFFFS